RRLRVLQVRRISHDRRRGLADDRHDLFDPDGSLWSGCLRRVAAIESRVMSHRQSTPLAQILAARIARDGPISVHAYMDACLNDPAHGYYRTRRAIGAKEDFITAPE